MSEDDAARVQRIRAELTDGFEAQAELLQALTILRAMVAHGVLSVEQSDGLKSAMAEDEGCIAAYALRVAVDTGDLDDFRRTVAVLLRSRAQQQNVIERPRAVDSSAVLLYFAPGMAEVAGRVALHAPGSVQLGHISWERFPDGFPNLFIQDASRVRGRRCAFLADLNTPEEIFQQVRPPPASQGRPSRQTLPRLDPSSRLAPLPPARGDLRPSPEPRRLLPDHPSLHGG